MIGTLPLVGTKTIVILKSIQITGQALELLFDKGIDVIFTSLSGKISGMVNAQVGGGAIVKLAQHSAFMNPESRLAIAKTIVAAKIANQRKLISKTLLHRPLPEYRQSQSKMAEYAQALNRADNLDTVMGIEGICARVYWQCFRQMLHHEIRFEKREYRPAADMVNSALNLGYSFLASELTTCLSAHKFDLEIGFLHSIHYGRNSLALDIMEEFRSPFVDAWLLTLFNKRMLTSEHFCGPDAGYYLNDQGFDKFCSFYHEHIKDNAWRGRFRTQSDRLKKALLYHLPYQPYQHE
jgi:CRISPR-associated protein Cas1